MNVYFHKNFRKAYNLRVKSNINLDKRFQERLKLFKENSKNPILKDHALTGSKLGYRAFSVTGDIRIVYEKIDNDNVVFYDIGTHNQVY